MKKKIISLAALTVISASTLAIYAGITFDPMTGIGFAGKGDVQLTFGWNNAQLQQKQDGVSFKVEQTTVKVTEVSWVCTNENNQKTQERLRTTTTTSSYHGVFSAKARIKNQMTGWNLIGYQGSPVIIQPTTEEDGPALNSCPNANGTWSLTTPAGAPEVITDETEGGLLICHLGDCRAPVIPAPVL